MNIKSTYVFSFIISICMGCSQAGSTNMELNQEGKIKECLNNMWAAIEVGDIEKYASYIHPEFTQFGESDSILKIGKEQEVSSVKSWLENSSNIHTEMEEPLVVIKDNVAWITYYWNDHGLNGDIPFSSRGKSTRIFVNENGKWLCIHGHYTLLPKNDVK